MKIELKHLSAYLPYGLTCIVDNDDNDCVRMELTSLTTASSYECADFVSMNTESNDTVNMVHIENIVPVLRPLSDLYNTENFSISKLITHGYHNTFWSEDKFSVNHIYYHDLLMLLKWHFDVFNLIEQGLAIDINTL